MVRAAMQLGRQQGLPGVPTLPCPVAAFCTTCQHCPALSAQPCRFLLGLQVELLLTFEEYCEEEGDFASGDNGSGFAPLFPQV